MNQVIAHWHGRQYPAEVNAYGVATIARNAKPIDEPDRPAIDVDLLRWHDDGGPAHE